jgi:hypothetical protein
LPTNRQISGTKGETLVAKHCHCPKCKKRHSLRKLPLNFKCADVICDFCGFLAQVKTLHKNDISQLPNSLLGGAWSVQKERIDAGIYFPLYIVLISNENRGGINIHYLPVDFQVRRMYIPRKPLSKKAKRAGWQGFIYDLEKIDASSIIKIYPEE